MAEGITIRNLRIKVTSDTSEAVSALERLKGTISSLKAFAATGLDMSNATQGISKFVSDMSKLDIGTQTQQLRQLAHAVAELRAASQDGWGINIDGLREAVNLSNELRQNTGQTTDAAKEMNEEMENTGRAALRLNLNLRNARSTIFSVLTRIGRIAFNRLIRSALSLFTKGIGEGFTNFIHWSDSARASMDQFATSSTYLKNSIAATLMPILIDLIPVFQRIVNWIAQATEAISMFYAYMNGRGTYVRANKDYFTAWSDSADKANQKAKAFKATILGFDEINALNDNSATGSGSGSAINYNDMFEEAEIDMEIVNRVKEIYDYVVLIGQVLAGLWVAKEVIAFFTMLNNMGLGAKVMTAGLTIAVEFALVKSSVEKIALGEGGLKEWLTAGLAAALGTAFLGFMFGPAGAVIGIGVALVATVLGIESARKIKWEQTELYKEIMAIKAKAEESIEITKEITVNIETRAQGLNDIYTTYNTAIKLIDKIYELAAEETKSDSDISRLKVLVDTVNGLGFGTLIQNFDELTGSVNDSKQSVTDLLTEITKLSLGQYASENLGAALDDQSRAQQALDQAIGAGEETLQKWAAYLLQQGFSNEEVQNAVIAFEQYAKGLRNTPELDQLFKDSSGHGVPGGQVWADLQESYQTSLTAISDAEQAVKDATDEVDRYTNIAMGNFELEMTDTGHWVLNIFDKISDGAHDAADNVAESFYGAATSSTADFDAMAQKMISFDGTNITFDLDVDTTEAEESLNEFGGFWERFFNEIKEKFDPATLTGMTDSQSWDLYDLTNFVYPSAYASGGFPEDGLFFANSGEMVGKFSNGKTAVANNAEIVEGIASGVRRAMSDFDGGDITVQIINPDGSVANETTITSAERRNRRAGATVIPVGV